MPVASSYPIFRAPGNIWTTRLPANAPLATDSADVVARLTRQMTYGTSVNGAEPLARYTGQWYHFIGRDWLRIWPSIPASTSAKRVLWINQAGNPVDPESKNRNFPLQSWIDAVPVPDVPLDQLRSEGGGDKPLVLYQPSSDTLWEFWKLEQTNIARAADGLNYYTAANGSKYRADYTARYAGRITPASQSNGVYPLTTGSSATSLSYANGLIMVRDAIAGRIDHALTISLPVTGNVGGATWCSSPTMWVAPATRCDTHSFLRYIQQPDGTTAPPEMRPRDGIREGTLFRFPATFNPAEYAPGTDDRSVFLRMVLTAMRDYGVYVTDTSPTISINAEGTAVIKQNTIYHDVRPEQVPAWWGQDGIFGGKNNITFSIPWDKLQVVAPSDWRHW